METSINDGFVKTAIRNGNTNKNLTPIRRIGLSRNRKTPIVFNSPQMGTNVCSLNDTNVNLTNQVKNLITTPPTNNSTPCRRIGLSRKRKTPLASLSSESKLEQSCNNKPVEASVGVEDVSENCSLSLTPVVHKDKSKRSKITKCLSPVRNLSESTFLEQPCISEPVETSVEVDNVSKNCPLSLSPVVCKDKLKRSQITKHFDSTSDISKEIERKLTPGHQKFDLDDANETKVTSKSKQRGEDDSNMRKKTKKLKRNLKQIKNVPSISEIDGDTTTPKFNESDDKTATVESCFVKIEKFDSANGCNSKYNGSGQVTQGNEKVEICEKVVLNQNEVDSESDDDLLIVRRKLKVLKDSNCENEITTSSKLETKFTSCGNLNEVDASEAETFHVQCENTTPNVQFATTPNLHKNITKLRKRLSLKKSVSSSTFDLIESHSPIRSNNSSQFELLTGECNVDENSVIRKTKIELVDDILELERQIRDKETHLGKLKHAEVYHNLHNLEELSVVTNVWKTGCQYALKDLLGKLKEHATINMSMLLLNLKVPETLVRYNVEDDCFM